jgi:hypothetical protein
MIYSSATVGVTSSVKANLMSADQDSNRGRWMESDSKRIVREWNREIEAEIRRRDARKEDGPWKIVVWLALAALWFVALFAVLSLFERLQR